MPFLPASASVPKLNTTAGSMPQPRPAGSRVYAAASPLGSHWRYSESTPTLPPPPPLCLTRSSSTRPARLSKTPRAKTPRDDGTSLLQATFRSAERSTIISDTMRVERGRQYSSPGYYSDDLGARHRAAAARPSHAFLAPARPRLAGRPPTRALAMQIPPALERALGAAPVAPLLSSTSASRAKATSRGLRGLEYGVDSLVLLPTGSSPPLRAPRRVDAAASPAAHALKQQLEASPTGRALHGATFDGIALRAAEAKRLTTLPATERVMELMAARCEAEAVEAS